MSLSGPGWLNRSGWGWVLCPNHEEHSDRQTLASYKPRGFDDSYRAKFKCHHSHCKGTINLRHFYEWVAEDGGPNKIREWKLQNITTRAHYRDLKERLGCAAKARRELLRKYPGNAAVRYVVCSLRHEGFTSPNIEMFLAISMGLRPEDVREQHGGIIDWAVSTIQPEQPQSNGYD